MNTAPVSVEQRIELLAAKVDLVLARLDQMSRAGKPGMSQREFAKLIGRHPKTVSRMVADKRIVMQRGVIPHSEVQKYLS